MRPTSREDTRTTTTTATTPTSNPRDRVRPADGRSRDNFPPKVETTHRKSSRKKILVWPVHERRRGRERERGRARDRQTERDRARERKRDNFNQTVWLQSQLRTCMTRTLFRCFKRKKSSNSFSRIDCDREWHLKTVFREFETFPFLLEGPKNSFALKWCEDSGKWWEIIGCLLWQKY
jgi:hypothetical protein